MSSPGTSLVLYWFHLSRVITPFFTELFWRWCMPPGFEKSQSSSGHGLGSCLIQEVVDSCCMVLIKPKLCFISILCWDSILMRV